MTSINTNIAATTALRTLQSTNSQLEQTQSRISTGLKIGEAKDNAAFWSISTAMRSDTKSLSTVKDALNLGAGAVDVAYRGFTQAKDVLDEIQSKLSSALSPSSDRAAIQKDLDGLMETLRSIGATSVFSGENWLSVNSSAGTVEKSIVSSFSRDASGTIQIGTIDIDIGATALFDQNGGGIIGSRSELRDANGARITFGGIDSASAGPDVSGLGTTSSVATGRAETAQERAKAVLGTLDLSGLQGNDRLTFNLRVDGGATHAIEVDLTAGMNRATLETAIQNAIDASPLGAGAATVAIDTDTLEVSITSPTFGTDSRIQVSGLNIADGNGTLTSTLGLTASPVTGTPGNGTTTQSAVDLGDMDFTGIQRDDRLQFSLTLGATTHEVTVSLAGVDLATAGTTDRATFRTAVQSAIDAQFGAGILSVGGTGAELLVSTVAASDDALDATAITALEGNGARSTTLGLGDAADTGVTQLNARAAKVITDSAFSGPVTLDANQTISFDIAVDGGAVRKITIDQKLVDRALEDVSGYVEGSGVIATADSLALVAQAALRENGIDNVNVSDETTPGGDFGKLVFEKTTPGAGSIAVTNVGGTGGADTITLAEIDLTSKSFTDLNAAQQSEALNAYIRVASAKLKETTSAAATFGSIASRVELQQTFVNTLIDTIDKGISGLVDADMNEESTRLQALQVKQQLGVQALSIANQSAQNVLRLFQ